MRGQRFGKYGVAPKVERQFLGETYPSKAEAAYAAQLETMRRTGLIRHWHRAQPIPLDVNGYHVGNYRADFEVWRADGSGSLVEVKGSWTEAARLRIKLARACYPKLSIVCVRRAWGKFTTIPTPQPSSAVDHHVREDFMRAVARRVDEEFMR